MDPRAGIAEASLRIGGMRCAACALAVEDALRAVPGVLAAQVSAASGYATVRWDRARTAFDALAAAVGRAGYRADADGAGASRLARARERRQALWRLFVAAFCAMQTMMFAAPAYVSAPGELAPDLARLLAWAGWLMTLPVMGFAAAPFFAGAWRAVRARRIGMDVPVALGIGVAFVASSGAAFDPGGVFGADVWFDSLTMFVAFLLGGRWLEMAARHRAEAALEDATARLPERVLRVADDGSVAEVDAAALRPGDRVRVPVGQAFAADGVLVDGRTDADESLLTGEPRPVAKAPGDAVVAGSLNVGAPVCMRVERVGADTRYDGIVALMRAARGQRPALAATADACAGAFLWAVLALAALAGAAWSAFDPARAVAVVVAVLIVTCPCALSLATPAALLAAAGAMGRRGLVLRRLDAIETLARVQTLFVDKTGTLTDSRLALVGVERLAADGPGVDALQATAASLAGWSHHPLARALAQDGSAPGAWIDIREEAGQGVEGRSFDGQVWRLGAPAWAGALPPGDGAEVVLACDGRALARFLFDEALRPDAAAAVRALQADGVAVRLLSGDRPARVQRIAAALGVDGAAGGLTPADKLAALRAAQAGGAVVAMVGDGINDAPVLACADVAFAMGDGAAVARTQADGVLVSNRLADLLAARRLARRALVVVRQNLAWACAYNAACVPLALAGWLPPWAAGLGMAASSLVVVGNALRLAR